MFWSEAERSFHEEVREKKRTASGVHHKTGKNGYVGTMRFPSDIMSRSEKIRYRRSSKVMTTNLYTEILPIEEFNKLDQAEKTYRMTHWRENYSNKQIQKEMGIANSPYYKIVEELKLPKAPRAERKAPRQAKVQVKQEQKHTAIVAEAPKPVIKKEEIEAPPVQEILVDGLHLIFNGTYKSEHIQKQMFKFISLLDDEPDDFFIEFKLMQKIGERSI